MPFHQFRRIVGSFANEGAKARIEKRGRREEINDKQQEHQRHDETKQKQSISAREIAAPFNRHHWQTSSLRGRFQGRERFQPRIFAREGGGRTQANEGARKTQAQANSCDTGSSAPDPRPSPFQANSATEKQKSDLPNHDKHQQQYFCRKPDEQCKQASRRRVRRWRIAMASSSLFCSGAGGCSLLRPVVVFE